MSDHDPENTHQQGPVGQGRNPAAGDAQTLDWHDGDMPYSQEFGDHFYCREDGRLECGHVFLGGNGLPARWQTIAGQDGIFRIGELGFGTGLNFCETWRQWKTERLPGTELHFHSFELFPMKREEIDRALSRWPQIDAERKALVAAWPEIDGDTKGEITIRVDEQTTLTVHCGPALDGVGQAPVTFDAWYLDGFAPSRNPDMWSAELMQLVFDKTTTGGSFATYAAAGFVRRNLVAAGYAVERPPGFAGKREMLRGTKA